MRKRITSLLLTLVMLLSLVPAMGVTALAADTYPTADVVSVDGGKSFYDPGRLYYKNGDAEKIFNGTSTDYNAHYDPTTGVLTLNNYKGESIVVGGATRADITIDLVGTNTVNGSVSSDMGGDITVTSSSGGGTLSITQTTNGKNPAIGIETGFAGSYTTGNVTIKGDAEVTINMTQNGTSTYEKAYGIFARENITISDSASVDITCATPSNTMLWFLLQRPACRKKCNHQHRRQDQDRCDQSR